VKKALCLMVCLILSPALWADDVKPPVPLPADDAMPPPLDLNSLTPVTLPPGAGDQNPPPPSAGSTPSTGSGQAVPIPTDTPLPPPPPDTPTPTPVKKKAKTPTPTPTETEAEATSTPTEIMATQATPTAETGSTGSPQADSTPSAAPPAPVAEAATGAALSAGALTDYFPVAEGASNTYEYLKPAAGQTAKGTFTVKCASAKTMANGTVRVTMETTEGSQTTRDRYSLFGNQVEHVATDDQAFTGDFAFKLPPAGGTAVWTLTEKDGTVHKFKAAYGQAQVYQKTYPDCVIVTEKVVKEAKTAHTIIYYYAKGIGLVSMEVYSPGMKLLLDKSYALVQAADGASN